MTSRAQTLADEQLAYIRAADTKTLLAEIRERVMPILTHETQASTMRVPADYFHDDDLYVGCRIAELLRRNP